MFFVRTKEVKMGRQVLPFLLLLTLFLGVIAQEDDVPDMSSTFTAARDKFDPKSKRDCNPDKTLATLKYLSLTPDQIKDPKLTKEVAGMPLDCSMRLTDLPKLRNFLEVEGYMQTGFGSLVFINYQDTQLKLECSPKADDKKYRWKSYGLKEDDQFYHVPHQGRTLHIPSPAGYLYFRRFVCFSKKEGCTHNFYVFTRPHVKMTFPLQALEYDNINIDCKLSPCTLGKCKVGKEEDLSRSNPPYEFLWRVPPKAVKKGVKSKEYSCAIGNHDDKVEKPVYVTEMEAAASFIESVKLLPKKTENVVVEVDKDKKEKKMPLQTKSVLSISRAKDTHAGFYECVVIDDNGIPSTPTHNSLHKHERFTGRSKLHVRKIMFVIIPSIFIGLIILLMLIIWIIYRKEDRMEHDDGTPYKKEDDDQVSPDKVSPDSERPPPPSKVASKATTKMVPSTTTT